MEQPIADGISWSPTFHLRPNRALIVAVEVNEFLFPEVLKIAAHDIDHYDFPIAVYQACPLDIYQKDPRLARANLLCEHGFGIITVDDAGAALIRARAEPLAQHIPKARFDVALRPLTQRLRVRFQTAYATYQTNIGQGLQEAGQIIEALITSITEQAETAQVVPSGTSQKTAAGMIDALYPTNTFHNHRAALGGARNFATEYRNLASHPQRTPQEVADKIRRCKAGFLESLRLAGELRTAIQQLGYQVRIV